MPTSAVFTGLDWHPVHDARELVAYPFMQHALAAGTIVAVTAGVVGWFMVLRRQSFAGHTLSLTAFTGASAAGLAGVPVIAGYYLACGAGAVALAAASGSRRSLSRESAATGSVQALALALGFLFISLYHGLLSDLDSLLFGTFLGVTRDQVLVLLLVAAPTLALVAVAARPLLYASVDPDVAGAAGIRVRLLGLGFLLVLGISVAETAQITGALLVFALLVTPAAAAHRITARPVAGVAVSVALALAVTWTGLALAYFSVYPVGFWITSVAFAVYVVARAAT
ncbi:MAG: metal ABC transporter permease [Acidobacteriota bacterium]|nr:metal ABC transporter permease [Acidobacteriota bacterium]